MKKVFGIAAMLLALAACNKVETEVQPVENNEGIPFSATISVGNNTDTKALAESGTTIVATWAVDETVALIHNGVKDEMTVSAVNAGVATITGTITGSPSNGDAVTVIYPASAADGTTGNIKADLLYEQNGLLTGAGSIATNYDARKGTGTLKVSGTTASLNGNMTLDNQFAIFKFTTKNSNGSATIDVTSLTVTTGGQDYVITPASATYTLYAALPAISGQAVTFTATGSDSKTYTASKASVTFAAGKYYQSTLKMTEAKAVGDIVFSDGSATAYTSGLTLTDEQKAAAVAVIFYAGSASDILGAKTLGVGLKNTNDETTKTLAFARNASGNAAEGYNTNITAIQCTPSESGDGKAATATFTGDLDGSDNWTALCAAVNDEGTSGNYPAWEWVNAYATTANLTGEYASGWYLPTVAELCMLYRAKDTVNAALEKADGTIIVDNYYWSSSQSSNNSKAWMVKFDSGKLMDTYKGNKWYVCGVRAFN